MSVTSYPERGGLGGAVTPSYNLYADLPAAGTVGREAWVKRLCGNGYFKVMDTGARWAVQPWHSIIKDFGAGGAGYPLTATDTGYTVLASYTIPAGLVGDLEEWFAVGRGKNSGTYASGNDQIQVRFASLSNNGYLLNSSAVSSASRVCRGEGRFARIGTTITRNTSGITYSNSTSGDQTLNLGAAVVVDVGFIPGASGNTMKVDFWEVGRFA